MWFVLLGVALVGIVVAGTYVRRRLATALGALGVGPRGVRAARWVSGWLLLAYPAVFVVLLLARIFLGVSGTPLEGRAALWLFALPFAWTMLVALQAAPWLLLIDGVAWLRRRAPRTARRRALATLTVLAGFGLYTPARIVAEDGDVALRRHAVALGGGGAPAMRIAFVADVQQDAFLDAEQARAVYRRISASGPDLVLSGGDWINQGPGHIEAAAAAGAELRSRLGTYSVFGDHDHFAYRDRQRSVREVEAALARHGVAIVGDELRRFDHHGRRVAVLFLNHNYLHRADPRRVEELLAEAADADVRIALTHQLDRGLAGLLRGRVDLILAAHTHGGQINPVLGVVHVPPSRIETRFVDGRYALDGTAVIVTAGIGYSIFPFRYAAPATFEVIDLAF